MKLKYLEHVSELLREGTGQSRPAVYRESPGATAAGVRHRSWVKKDLTRPDRYGRCTPQEPIPGHDSLGKHV